MPATKPAAKTRQARPPEKVPKGKWLLRKNRPGTEGIGFS